MSKLMGKKALKKLDAHILRKTGVKGKSFKVKHELIFSTYTNGIQFTLLINNNDGYYVIAHPNEKSFATYYNPRKEIIKMFCDALKVSKV